MMAASKSSVEIESLEGAHTRAELIALGGTAIQTMPGEEGQIVEIFSFNPKGSIGRAIAYGLLDVGTIFLWELAGTPLESYLTDKHQLFVKATIDREEQIQKLELY